MPTCVAACHCVYVCGRRYECVSFSVCVLVLFYVRDQCVALSVSEAHKLCLGDNYCMSNDIIVP